MHRIVSYKVALLLRILYSLYVWMINGKLAREMRVITTNRICKACIVELCDRKLEADDRTRHWWVRYDLRHKLAQQVPCSDQLSEQGDFQNPIPTRVSVLQRT